MTIDRDDALVELRTALTEATAGTGGLTVLRGSAATGKTDLLHTLSGLAAELGFQTRHAIGSPMEQPFPYALLEQLFPEAGPEPSGTPGSVPPDVLRRVYDAARHAAARQPLLLAVDDVQHADAASLQCLLYLIRRLRGVPIAVVTTMNPYTVTGRALLAELQFLPGARCLRLGTLTPAAVTRLLATELGQENAGRLTPDYLALSGGNPLLLRELLRAATLSGADGPQRPVVTDDFLRAALSCAHRGGADTRQVAHALALLDTGASAELVSRLADRSPAATSQAMDALTESGLLSDGRFRHPALRTAVLADIPADTHTELRCRAAELLYANGAPPTLVATHLLEGGPIGEAWEAPLLRLASHQFLADGLSTRAAQCRELASRCTTNEKQSLADQAAAAGITWRTDPNATVPHLQSLVSAGADGALPLRNTLQLIRALLWNGLEDSAVAVSAGLTAPEQRPDATGRLLSTWLRLTTTYPDALARMTGALNSAPPAAVPPAADPVIPDLSAGRALHAALTDGTEEDVIADAEQVLQYLRLGEDSLELPLSALHALIYLDRLELADSWCDRLLAHSAKQTAPAWDALLISTKAMISLRTGNLPAARDQADESMSRIPLPGWGVGLALPLATLIEAHTALGDHETAGELLAQPLPDTAAHTRFGVHHEFARAQHHLAIGQNQAALACFLAIGERVRNWQLDSPGLVPWRTGAAEAWLRLDKPARAVQLANEQLALADSRLPRARGTALRILSATRAPSQRPRLLARAMEAFQSAGDRYGMTRTLADLGQAQQQLGNGSEARQTVRRAWRLAQECGAEKLLRTVLPPLSGDLAVPRTTETVSAAEPLSEAERRVAAVAAQGYTNREIAARLFITVSTVEQHLTRIYRKFGIKHRHQLPASLGFDTAGAA
ncbi:putative LuxR family transcriptional regulator [Streptomyces sp. NBRC 110611]|uniref:helix-turn-helix transcriptional regulator n=1 Tax=Streptomyces sp. NBRC 110611 TaxID=1621259 RepID=UPI00085877E8|nr:LuxR family transcriptional regulator [Streptomyces sp. NBRC 110611]GAU67591.1 putative LuxR family transcriptional regulator [Streptomyces sp. NBRC 110611]